MNYRVLYRKYRPLDFDNLVGQENIVRILKNSINNNKISHAYIFSGPRGTGKTSTAKIFAKNINCLEPVDGMSCNKCNNCLNIGSTSDIIEIDAASNNGVEEIRELINNIKLVPTMLKYKVYIIDEVHMLSTSAFNALLLTLEEPPSHVVFILATTNIESVPITILSRCQRFDFKKITDEVIYKRLKQITAIEKISITDEAILQIAKISDGGLRDSLSLLDQLSKENEIITEEIVFDYTGNVSKIIIDKIIKNINDNNAKEIENLFFNLFEKGVDFKLLIKGIICQIAAEVKDKVINNKKTRLTTNEFKNLILDLTEIQSRININVDVNSMLIITIFSYLEVKETVVTTNIEKQQTCDVSLNTNNLENINNLKNIRINNCFAEANKAEKVKIIPIWENFIEKSEVSLRGVLVDTSVAMCSKNIITIYVDRENDLEELENRYDNLYNNFLDFTQLNHKLVFVSKNKWNELVLKYKNDKESGIIYTVKDESNYIVKNKVNVDDIFDKIEEI